MIDSPNKNRNSGIVVISCCTHPHPHHHNYQINYDSDEESSYVDESTLDIYSNEDDVCDDLENLILDELEMEEY